MGRSDWCSIAVFRKEGEDDSGAVRTEVDGSIARDLGLDKVSIEDRFKAVISPVAVFGPAIKLDVGFILLDVGETDIACSRLCGASVDV